MSTYIALLRGINVGGKNKIKMVDLKAVFEGIGLEQVQTYIQSGNVLFKAAEEETVLREKIEKEIEKSFGFSVAVILRTTEEMEQIMKSCPFSEEEIAEAEVSSEAESLYVGLMLQAPLEEDAQVLEAYKKETEKYQIQGKEIFLLFQESIRNSKLANNLHKLKVPVTVRNWKTISKLFILAKAMKAE